MLKGVGREDAGDARIKAAAQEGGQAGLLEIILHVPLPLVAELRLFGGLVVGGVNVVGAGHEAASHDGEILVGEGDVQNGVDVVLFDHGGDLVGVVGVDLFGQYVVPSDVAFDLFFDLFAFRLGAAGDADVIKNFFPGRALVGGHVGHAAGADYQYPAHFYLYD